MWLLIQNSGQEKRQLDVLDAGVGGSLLGASMGQGLKRLPQKGSRIPGGGLEVALRFSGGPKFYPRVRGSPKVVGMFLRGPRGGPEPHHGVKGGPGVLGEEPWVLGEGAQGFVGGGPKGSRGGRGGSRVLEEGPTGGSTPAPAKARKATCPPPYFQAACPPKFKQCHLAYHKAP